VGAHDLRKRPRVLIAKTTPEVAKAVGRVLALDCDVVGSVTTAAQCWRAAQRLQPDVIVLDLNLPNVNGLEACRRIMQVTRREDHRVHGDERSGPQQQCLDVGASAFLAKGDGDLVSTIKRLCAD
jgi:two-component system chemotaxis response regulator CheB